MKIFILGLILYYNMINLETSSSASSLLKSRAGNYATSSIGYNFSGDFRDSISNPTSGNLSLF